MLAFLGSVLAEFIAGLAVWAITEGAGSPSGHQSIIIENAFFIDGVPLRWVPSSSRGSTLDEDNALSILVVLLVIGFIVGVGVSMLLVRDPYDIFTSICVSAIAVPLCTFGGGFLAGLWGNKTKQP